MQGIGDEGCFQLSKKHRSELEQIDLCKEDIKYLDENKIGNEGCLHLSKALWPNLQVINLGK